jgi:hypothetical protein
LTVGGVAVGTLVRVASDPLHVLVEMLPLTLFGGGGWLAASRFDS